MKKIIVLIIFVLVLSACAAKPHETANAEMPDANPISVVFTNVGKADSIILKIYDKIYMIDTGHKKSVPALFRALSIMGIEKIDGLFLTHTHSDHIGGTEALVQKYQVARLYSAHISEDKKNGKNKIAELASDLSLPHTKLSVGDEVVVQDEIIFQVLAPIVYNEDDDNDNSLVLMIELSGKRFLFTGDLRFAGENVLLESGADIDSHVLKVGYHGNKNATSLAFANLVSPEYAIISTDTTDGTNSAHSKVISNLKTAKVLLTQNYACGIEMNVGSDGNISIGDLKPIENNFASIEIAGIDLAKQTVTIKNNGEKIDISGYFIFSERGYELFIFPEGAAIDTGQIITVACTGGMGDYIWNDKNVWNVKNKDVGVLFDSFGNELSRFGE
jgi:competence protein ComEC